VSEFLLLGIRPVLPGELSPAGAARDLVALALRVMLGGRRS
jgi:hypothetical protein